MFTEDIRRLKIQLQDIFQKNCVDFVEPQLEKQKVLIGLSSGKERALVFSGFGNTIKSAYENATAKVIKHFSTSGTKPEWFYMAFVTWEEKQSLDEFYQELTATRRWYYRKGIAFDDFYQFAFLEQEVNGLALLKYADDDQAVLHDDNITIALRRKGLIGKQHTFSSRQLPYIISFTCKSIFYDGEYHALHSDGLGAGLRVVDQVDKCTLVSLIDQSAEYLMHTVREDGSFVYGYFPAYGKEIASYNTVRHGLSVMALMDVFTLTGDTRYIQPIEKSYRYFMEKYVIEMDDQKAVVIDPENDNEIRLGALGLAIIAILQYAQLFDDTGDVGLAVKLGNQILDMQDADSWNFIHVLNYPDLSIKDRFRIVYYSGEACYGLMHLYAYTKEERYLNAVQKAFAFFAANQYEKYSDHWLAYAANELTKHVPADQYFSFALKSAFRKIDFIIERETTYATLLELLNATYQMIQRIGSCGKEYLLEPYDMDRLYEAFSSRIGKQMNGIFFPELAMFFQNPEQIAYGVFIRHHFLRVRNDDVAHHIISWCHFIHHVLPHMGQDAVKLSCESADRREDCVPSK